MAVVIVVWQASNLYFWGSCEYRNFNEIEACVVKCDHDKGDGKDEEDPDGGHHRRDAPPRPSANATKSSRECILDI